MTAEPTPMHARRRRWVGSGKKRRRTRSSAFIWGVPDTPAGVVVGVDVVDDGRAADSASNVHRARTGHRWSNLARPGGGRQQVRGNEK